MCNKSYNGYTNYETWCVSLWIDNDQGLYATIYEQAQDFYDDTSCEKDDAAYNLQGFIKNYIEEMNPLSNDANLFSDMLNAALSEVNWYEIAENWIETIKEEM